jgi:hypothetical protein
MWLFAIAGAIALLGGTTGFDDLYIWGVVSLVFALMSWRGAKEKAKAETRKREQYEADIAAAASRITPSAPPPAPPPADH